MEALLPLGIVKAIGVSNFTITKLEALLPTVSVIPAVNQGMLIKNSFSHAILIFLVESNPQLLQRKLREYCRLKSESDEKSENY